MCELLSCCLVRDDLKLKVMSSDHRGYEPGQPLVGTLLPSLGIPWWETLRRWLGIEVMSPANPWWVPSYRRRESPGGKPSGGGWESRL